MKKIVHKLLYIGIIALIYIAFNNIKVQAASASLSATTTEPTEGQSVTVTATVTAGAWNLQLSGAGKSETLYGYTQSASNSSDSKSITFTAGSAGTTYNFTLTGDMTDINAENSQQVNEPLTITVKSKDNTSSGSDNTGSAGENTNTPAAKSTEARLSNFGITPNDFSGFKRDTTEYTHEVPNSVSEVTVYATPLDSKAKVTSGTGKVALKEGSNTIKVTVTAEAGNTKTYTLTIKRRTADEEAAIAGTTNSSDASLKSLGIKPEEYDFSGFQKDTTKYSTEVPNDIEEIEVYAEATSEKAQISGTGKVQLKEGKNTMIVQVTAEDGTTQTYTIEVTRKESDATGTTDDTEGNFGLSNLVIKDMELSPSFKTGIYEYTVELSEDLSSLDIEAIATDEDATIEIIGNEDLQQGENTITILVRNEETDETATYQIMVNKNIKEKTSWLKPSTWGKEEFIKLAIIVTLIILIIIAIILKIKIAKEKKGDKDMDLPGGEELDKALAEHQELAEAEELEESQNEQGNDEEQNSDDVQKYEEQQDYNDTETADRPKYISEENSEKTNYIEDIAKDYGIDDYSNDFSKNSKRKGKHF